MRRTGYEVLVENPWRKPDESETMAERAGLFPERFDTRYDPAGVWDIVSRQWFDPQQGVNPTAGLEGVGQDPRDFVSSIRALSDREQDELAVKAEELVERSRYDSAPRIFSEPAAYGQTGPRPARGLESSCGLEGLRSFFRRARRKIKKGWKRLGRSKFGRIFRTGITLYGTQVLGRVLGGAIGGRTGSRIIRGTRFFGGPRAATATAPRRAGGHLWRLFGGNRPRTKPKPKGVTVPFPGNEAMAAMANEGLDPDVLTRIAEGKPLSAAQYRAFTEAGGKPIAGAAQQLAGSSQNPIRRLVQSGLSNLIANKIRGNQPLSAEEREAVEAANRRMHELELSILREQARLERERAMMEFAMASGAGTSPYAPGGGIVPTDIPVDSPITDTDLLLADITEQGRLQAQRVMKETEQQRQVLLLLVLVAGLVYYYWYVRKKKR